MYPEPTNLELSARALMDRIKEAGRKKQRRTDHAKRLKHILCIGQCFCRTKCVLTELDYAKALIGFASDLANDIVKSAQSEKGAKKILVVRGVIATIGPDDRHLWAALYCAKRALILGGHLEHIEDAIRAAWPCEHSLMGIVIAIEADLNTDLEKFPKLKWIDPWEEAENEIAEAIRGGDTKRAANAVNKYNDQLSLF